jgi:uncharacterized protein YndB with AHSA1/START domain
VEDRGVRIEDTRRFAVPRQEVWDYLTDPATWPRLLAGLLEVTDPTPTSWAKPGDRVRFTYRLLGRRIEGELRLEEVIPAQYLKVHIEAPKIGALTQEWFFADAGEHSTTLRIICRTDEPTRFHERPIDRTVIPRAIQGDLTTTLDKLVAIFTLRLDSESPPQQSGRRV